MGPFRTLRIRKSSQPLPQFGPAQRVPKVGYGPVMWRNLVETQDQIEGGDKVSRLVTKIGKQTLWRPDLLVGHVGLHPEDGLLEAACQKCVSAITLPAMGI